MNSENDFWEEGTVSPRAGSGHARDGTGSAEGPCRVGRKTTPEKTEDHYHTGFGVMRVTHSLHGLRIQLSCLSKGMPGGGGLCSSSHAACAGVCAGRYYMHHSRMRQDRGSHWHVRKEETMERIH